MVIEWKPVIGFSKYEVSNTGEVRNSRGKVLYKIKNSNGYFYVALCNKKITKKYVHTLVCESFFGPKPSTKHCVCHGDGNKMNNHVSNLRWGTHKDNYDDKMRHGKHQYGDKNPSAKLSNEDVKELFELRKGGKSPKELSLKFGVSANHISAILRGKYRAIIP